jgi:hypothetical protein
MTSPRILSPVRTLAHRVAARSGAAVTIGLGGTTLVILGAMLHVTGMGHVFPGRLAVETPTSLAADVVLPVSDAPKQPPLTGMLLVADPGPDVDPPPLGPPTLLFTAPVPAAPPKPMRTIAAATPVNRPAPPRAAPAKPLIPPAPLPAKLGPPPDARSALPIDTDLQPLAPPAPASPAGGPAPAIAKPSTG